MPCPDVGAGIIAIIGRYRHVIADKSTYSHTPGDYWYHLYDSVHKCNVTDTPTGWPLIDIVDAVATGSDGIVGPANSSGINGTYDSRLLTQRAVKIIHEHPKDSVSRKILRGILAHTIAFAQFSLQRATYHDPHISTRPASRRRGVCRHHRSRSTLLVCLHCIRRPMHMRRHGIPDLVIMHTNIHAQQRICNTRTRATDILFAASSPPPRPRSRCSSTWLCIMCTCPCTHPPTPCIASVMSPLTRGNWPTPCSWKLTGE